MNDIDFASAASSFRVPCLRRIVFFSPFEIEE